MSSLLGKNQPPVDEPATENAEPSTIAARIARLYATPVPSSRKGAVFNSHSYPTKINPDAIVSCILAHTSPGQVVLDGFAGSGSTAIAATLCGRLGTTAQHAFRQHLGDVSFGERDAVLYDISPLAVFVASSLLNAPDPSKFAEAANHLLNVAIERLGWLYDATGPDGSPGTVRHTIWTEHLICPSCGNAGTFWDWATALNPPAINSIATCSRCQHRFSTTRAERETEAYKDRLLDHERARRLRSAALVYGVDKHGKTWRRAPNSEDLGLWKRIDAYPIPKSVPLIPMLRSTDTQWGEMFRAGYHFGIAYVHDFYTLRNLIAVGELWGLVSETDEPMRSALRLWVSSYNATHSTLMTRVVVKRNGRDFVLTGAQPGALYVSALPVEKNVFLGLRRKVSTMRTAFAALSGRTNRVEVRRASSLQLDLPDESIDYVFTDPPFGDNIQYSEVNFIAEAWLGQITEAAEEAIVSRHQGKGADEYRTLLTTALTEIHRVLKPGGHVTIAFHSTRQDIWESLRRAIEVSGFEHVASSILDKSQTSFKQTTTSGAVRRDPMIVLRKPTGAQAPRVYGSEDPWTVIASRIGQTRSSNGRDMPDRQTLFSYLAGYYMQRNLPLPLSAEEFFAGLEDRYPDLLPAPSLS